jgi:hypothetical protein
MQEPRELPETFVGRGEVRGFNFTQIAYSPNAVFPTYLYQVDNAGTTHYEIFARKQNHRHGVISYPTANAFGVWAKTCANPEKARLYFEWHSDMGNWEIGAKWALRNVNSPILEQHSPTE